MQQRMWQRGPDGEILRNSGEHPASASAEEIVPGESATGTARRRARLGIALRLGFRDAYDFLGSVLLVSTVAVTAAVVAMLGGRAVGEFLFGGVPAGLRLILTGLAALIGLVLLGAPVTAGLFRFARNAAAREEPELFDLAWGFRAALQRSLGLGAAQVAGVLLLAGNSYFYISQKHPLLVVLGATFGYVLGFWLLMMLYQWPLLVQQDISVPRVLKKSALLVLDNFGYSLLFGLLFGAVTLLLWAVVLPGVLLWGGVAAMLLTQTTRELLRKYDVLPPDPTLDPIAEETHELRGRGWHE